jgi:hypothetical protein
MLGDGDDGRLPFLKRQLAAALEESRAGANLFGALDAVEEVLLVRVCLGRTQLAEDVPFCRSGLHRFHVFHTFSHIRSVVRPPNVSEIDKRPLLRRR